MVCAQSSVSGQSSIRKQLQDDSAPQAMLEAELSELGDPMFLLVLKDQPLETRLDEIEKLILGQNGQRNLFVVDERLQDPAKGGSRRSVFTYSGTTGQGIRLAPNISLSLSFTEAGFAPGFIEAWGWDNVRSRYNYYKLDGTPPTWKFRGSSDGADQLDTDQRRARCMACHINGGPVMKELPFPWNNWHSFRNPVPYLTQTGLGHWKLAESARFRDLKGAETLETDFILPSIRQFNGRRFSAAIRTASGGEQEVVDAARLLKPLFRTTEYNVISAGQFSGLHPIPKSGTGPSEKIAVPETFFLNANLLAGGGIPQYRGVGVPQARQFSSLLLIERAEYRALVSQPKTVLGGLAGDTNFAWFVPESSHIDNQMVDVLIRRGVVTPEFAAAALAVDLENPVFSDRRSRLLAIVPQQFRFRLKDDGDVPAAHPDQLTRDVIARLKALPPAAGSPEAEFLTLLENPNPTEAVRAKVTAYFERVRNLLANPQQRKAEINRLYGVVVQRRQDARTFNPTLIESQFLFPTRTP
jgi:hypothetical protein